MFGDAFGDYRKFQFPNFAASNGLFRSLDREHQQCKNFCFIENFDIIKWINLFMNLYSNTHGVAGLLARWNDGWDKVRFFNDFSSSIYENWHWSILSNMVDFIRRFHLIASQFARPLLPHSEQKSKNQNKKKRTKKHDRNLLNERSQGHDKWAYVMRFYIVDCNLSEILSIRRHTVWWKLMILLW